MSEREVVLDEPVMDGQSEALQRAVERADRAEAELEKSKRGAAPAPKPAVSHTAVAHAAGTHAASSQEEGHARREPAATGIEALRNDEMMAYLLDSLDAGKDIGHYGRLVFAMIARHFLSDEEVIAELTKDRDFDETKATSMLYQVAGRDYSPPRRDRIVEWQELQEFPILPKPDDPDCGNVYRNLTFPQKTYEHIEHYQEEKAEAA